MDTAKIQQQTTSESTAASLAEPLALRWIPPMQLEQLEVLGGKANIAHILLRRCTESSQVWFCSSMYVYVQVSSRLLSI